MSFNIALSGIGAAQKDLDTTANNIANVNTVGFKESRAEFGDVYAASLLSAGKTKVGDGVLTQDVSQQFSQGSLKFTKNSLDLAITGNGFFATKQDPASNDLTYTRAGQFKLNKDNFVVNSSGDHLLAFPVNEDGTSASTALSTAQPLRIPDSSGAPKATTEVKLKVNLEADADPKDILLFDPTDSTTFNDSTSITIYDSLGESHTMTYYFVKDSTATNEWLMATYVDGQPLETTGDVANTPNGANELGATSLGAANAVSASRMVFSSGGDFQAIQNSQGTPQATGDITSVQLGAGILTNGSEPTQTISTNFVLSAATATSDEPTQFASAFEVTQAEQDGLAVGRLTGLEIGADGLVQAKYSNGTAEPIGRVAVARFANQQGLTQVGNSSWKESLDSGEALGGEATTGTFGEINSQALEQSNVNLTTELVDMIIAQRNFQANSRALEVNNTLNQTVLNIR